MPKISAQTRFAPNPLAPLAISFAVGIVAQHIAQTGLCLTACAAVITGVLAFVFRNRDSASWFASIAFFFLGGFCLAAQDASVRPDRVRVLVDTGVIRLGDPAEIVGTVVGGSESMPDGSAVLINAETIRSRGREINATGLVKLYISTDNDQALSDLDVLHMRSTTRISAACYLNREEAFQNPGVISRLELLDRQGIDATATIKSPLLIENLGNATRYSPLSWIYYQRERMIGQFRSRFDTSTAGTLIASLLGDKYFLDKETADVYREGGTFHVLVISGLHIKFIGGLLLLFARVFTSQKVLQFAIAAACLWAYTFAVGADVPVVRASLMFTVLLLSRVIYREGSLINSLAACAILLLSWRPSDLFQPSFQLTFASVGAIVVAGFPLVEKLRKIGAWSPSANEPFPPRVPDWLRRFCETVYWREEVWLIESGRLVWSARIFKSPLFAWPRSIDLRKTLCVDLRRNPHFPDRAVMAAAICDRIFSSIFAGLGDLEFVGRLVHCDREFFRRSGRAGGKY